MNRSGNPAVSLASQSDINVLCDPSFTVATWLSTILQEVPAGLRQSVIFKLVQALLQVRLPRSQVRTKHIQLPSGCRDELVVGRDSYHVSDTPGPQHLRGCKATLRRKRRP